MNRLLLLLIGLCFSFTALAHDEDHGHRVSYAPSEQSANAIGTSTIGIPLSISIANIDFSHSSKKWQGGVGVGFFDDRTAIAAGVGKRFRNTLVKGTIGIEEGHIGGGLGIMFQFN